MLSILKEIYRAEGEIVLKHRAKGETAIRLSTILVDIIALIYIISPYDLVPEAIIHPSAFAYVDDFVILLIALYYTYKDVGEVVTKYVDRAVQQTKVSAEEKPDRESDIPVEVEPRKDVSDNFITDASRDNNFKSDEHPSTPTLDSYSPADNDLPGAFSVDGPSLADELPEFFKHPDGDSESFSREHADDFTCRY